ncbi:MAG TPA: ribose 5-phosphate isomerase B [Vicinamibacteria bacterium]|nr:ribose 5-phosphate isomerase B [Vicinamibacteria bacterium]
MKTVVTGEDVLAVPQGGEIQTSPGAVITPWARELADTRRVCFVTTPAAQAGRLVAIGADHGGFPLKEDLKRELTRLGHAFRDFGTFSTDAVDYPDIALAVAQAVRAGEARFGILVDGAGIGSAMAANKVPGVRAALCVDANAATNAREHNDANVLTLGAKFVEAAQAREIVARFLSTECTEERHVRRVKKIRAIEERYLR